MIDDLRYLSLTDLESRASAQCVSFLHIVSGLTHECDEKVRENKISTYKLVANENLTGVHVYLPKNDLSDQSSQSSQ